jgi:hypothetical protein
MSSQAWLQWFVFRKEGQPNIVCGEEIGSVDVKVGCNRVANEKSTESRVCLLSTIGQGFSNSAPGQSVDFPVLGEDVDRMKGALLGVLRLVYNQVTAKGTTVDLQLQ